jgi:hypothetical protein
MRATASGVFLTRSRVSSAARHEVKNYITVISGTGKPTHRSKALLCDATDVAATPEKQKELKNSLHTRCPKKIHHLKLPPQESYWHLSGHSKILPLRMSSILHGIRKQTKKIRLLEMKKYWLPS